MIRPLVTFERFLPTLLALSCTAAICAFGATVSIGVSNALAGEWEADMPPAIVAVLTVGAFALTFVLGGLAVPFRPLVVGPRFPFVRWGYVVIALLPVAYMAAAEGAWYAKVVYGLLAQIPLALAGLVFVWLARGFGAFGEDELARPRKD